MSYTYPTVTIGSNSFPVYDTLEDASAYLSANIAAANWAHASNTLQSQALITAVRWMNIQAWCGEKTEWDNALDWPRKNIKWVNPATIQTQVCWASFELALALVDDPELRLNLWDPIANSVSAGSARASFFRPYDVQVVTPLPKIVMSLVGQWMGKGPQQVIAKGDKEKSPFDDPFSFEHGI